MLDIHKKIKHYNIITSSFCNSGLLLRILASSSLLLVENNCLMRILISNANLCISKKWITSLTLQPFFYIEGMS